MEGHRTNEHGPELLRPSWAFLWPLQPHRAWLRSEIAAGVHHDMWRIHFLIFWHRFQRFSQGSITEI